MVLEEKQFGTHTLRFDDDAIITLVLRGHVSGEDMAFLAQQENSLPSSASYTLLLADVTELISAAPSARQRAGARAKQIPRWFIAYVGASFRMRVMSDLFVRAANLLGGQQITHRFFATQAEGRAWLLERRRELDGY